MRMHASAVLVWNVCVSVISIAGSRTRINRLTRRTPVTEMGVTNQIKNRGHGQCRRRLQRKITEYDANCDECNYPNIEPQGDTIVPREDGDNKYRQVWHNVHGSRHTGVMSSGEVEAIHNIGANIAGYTETNKPWSLGSKNEYDMSMRNMVGPHRTQYASAPAEFDCKYQNGGCLLSVKYSIDL